MQSGTQERSKNTEIPRANRCGTGRCCFFSVSADFFFSSPAGNPSQPFLSNHRDPFRDYCTEEKNKKNATNAKKKQRPNYRFDALNKKFFVFCLNGSRWRHPSRPHPRRCGETRYNSVNWKNKKGRRRRRWWWRRRRRSMRSPNGRPAGRCPPNGVVYTALVWRHYWRRRRTDSEKTKKNEGKTKKKRNQIEINFLSCLTLGVVSIALANQVGYWFFFTGFYRVLLNRIGFWRVFLGWKWVLLGFHEWNRIWFCITGFYLVLLGFIGFYWLLPGIVESNWIFEIFLGVLLGFVG